MAQIHAERVYDATFARLGFDAAYLDGVTEPAPACRLLAYEPDANSARPSAGFDFGRVAGAAEQVRYFLVRRKEVARPRSGQGFLVGEGDAAHVWRIGEDDPVAHDTHGITWRCACVQEAPE